MKDLESLQKEYGLLKIHKNSSFCHSMNNSGYKILYKNFFADEINKKLALKLAEESNLLSVESENKFLQWLNME